MVSFLSAFTTEDVVKATIQTESTALWAISPPSNQSLIKALQGNDSIYLITTIQLTRCRILRCLFCSCDLLVCKQTTRGLVFVVVVVRQQREVQVASETVISERQIALTRPQYNDTRNRIAKVLQKTPGFDNV